MNALRKTLHWLDRPTLWAWVTLAILAYFVAPGLLLVAAIIGALLGALLLVCMLGDWANANISPLSAIVILLMLILLKMH
jgi:hypothetical protein